MRSPKAEVASMLEALSDDANFEYIQYHLYVLEKVKRGLDRVETEGAVPHEEAKKRLSMDLVKYNLPKEDRTGLTG